MHTRAVFGAGDRPGLEPLESRLLLAAALFPCSQVPVGDNPQSAYSADFNGDGHADLAVANYTDRSVTVLPGTGDGGFGAGVDLALSGYALAVMAADFNGDGYADIVAPCDRPGLGAVNVLLSDGAGSFLPRETYDARGHWTMALADFNTDGHIDIAASGDNSPVSVLLGNGDGTFQPHQEYAGGKSIVAGDFDADGHVDVAVAARVYSGGWVGCVRVLWNDGAAGFATYTDEPLDALIDGVAAADFNEDGHLDLAASYSVQGMDTVELLLGNGDRTFQPPVALDVPEDHDQIASEDFNADGHADLLTYHRLDGTVSIRLGNGDGTFQASTIQAAGESPRMPAVADFNEDGRPDLAVPDSGNDAVSVLIGSGDGGFSPLEFEVGDGPRSILSGDFNNDGALDLATAHAASWPGEPGVSVVLGNADGTFQPHVYHVLDHAPYSVAGADFDGDGFMDLAAAGGGYVTVLLGRGGGGFDVQERQVVNGSMEGVVAADLDGDSHVDLAVTRPGGDDVVVLLGNGDGTFQDPISRPLGGDYQAIAVGHLDGDAVLDLAVVSRFGDAVSVLAGNGDGSFQDPVSYVVEEPYGIAAADLNDDGWTDLATASHTADTVAVLLNDGDGTYADPVEYDIGTPAQPDRPYWVAAADLDGDGLPDLATANRDTNTVSVLLGNGDGTFQPSLEFVAGISPYALCAADLNADGALDLATADYSSDNVTVLTSRARWTSRIEAPRQSGEILAGDILRLAGHGQVQQPPAAFEWGLGDARTSTVEDPGLVRFPTEGVWDITFAVIDAQGAADPQPDTRTITVVADPGAVPDLAVAALTVPADLSVGQAATIDYSVVNQGGAAVTGLSWVDAIYLSADPYLDSRDLLLVTSDPISVTLNPQERFDGSLEVVVPSGIAEGAYYLVLSVDDQWQVLERHQLNNESSQATGAGIPALTDGVAVGARLTPGAHAHYYRIEVPVGAHLLVGLDDADDQGVNELYLRHGQLPSRGKYDYRHDAAGGADQHVFVSSPSPSTWYVLAYGARLSAGGEYSIVADLSELGLASIVPGRNGDVSPTRLVLTGVGFDVSTAVELVAADATTYAPGRLSLESPTRLVATFDAGSVPPGTYTVRASNAGGATAELADAFEVVSGGEGLLETHLVVPAVVGYHLPATLYIEYANRGDAAMPAPLLHLTATQNGREAAVLTLDASRVSKALATSALPEGFSNSVQFLAGGESPGVLQTGESMRVPVYYVGWQYPWDMSYPPIHWTLTEATADSTLLVGWDDLKDGMQPDWAGDEAWEPIWANFVSQAGDTWGEYVTMLADDASYLGRLGEWIVDAGTLLGFELQQADGFSPTDTIGGALDAYVTAPGPALSFIRSFPTSISDRYETGPFGRGWAHNWQSTLEVAADGTVSIHEPGSPPRVFQPDRRGGYLASPGDHSTLAAAGGGTFTLTDIRGTVVAYTADGSFHYTEDTNGNRITAGYTNGLLTRLDHSSGQWLELTYDAADHIERITGCDGSETTFTYDAADEHLASVAYDDGRTIHYTYSSGEGAPREHTLTGIVSGCGCGGDQYFTYDAAPRPRPMRSRGPTATTTTNGDGWSASPIPWGT